MIRGGAIGDFILTLPALKALRDAYPGAHIEVLGYKHIVALAERQYANSVRSIEYGPLSSLFAKNAMPAAELVDYFGNFDLIISYLYDPDQIFDANLRRCGVKRIVHGPAKIGDSGPASRQLVAPIKELGIPTSDLRPRIFLSDADRQLAGDFLGNLTPPLIAIHPGSGSDRKNWPLQNWIELGNAIADQNGLIVVAGEADEVQAARLKREWNDGQTRFAENLPLPQLAAVLERTVFVGHDSGISHLAAAVGANCVLLFGPTNPKVWAPLNQNVTVLRAPDGDLRRLDVAAVRSALAQALAQSRR